MNGVTVQFGSVVALDDVTLILEPGQRHAVVGENGAGKSTLMKVLFGLLTPDSGEVRIGGTAVQMASPAEAIAHGIGMVQQHFELIGAFTAAENILLGAEMVGPGGILDRGAGEAAVRKLGEESGLAVEPAARVDELSVAAQQRIEILKALYRQARVLILDEPTAVLAPSEARDLWRATAQLAEAGTTVVFITHKLDEVMANADAVTVLRRGKRILSTPSAETNPAKLAAAMIGAERPPTETAWSSPQEPGDIALELKGVSVQGGRGEAAVSEVSLTVRSGEILGIAGVDGSGQRELLEAILGLRPVAGGQIHLRGEGGTLQDVTGAGVRERRALGVAGVPEDRHHRAVALNLPCEENAALGQESTARFSWFGWLKSAALAKFLTECAKGFDVRGAGTGKPMRSLSGGNQQKLVMAREMARQPRVIIAAQPTRGLDFAATEFVHQTLRSARDRGAAVVVQSLDLGEVLNLADRVAVMYDRRVVAVLSREEATEERVGAWMTGAGGTTT